MSPIRTCVGCGHRASRASMTRFVAREGALQVDPAGRLPGRGAWLHRGPACLEAFATRRGSIRSLRCTPARGAREALVVAMTAGVRG